MASKPGKPSRRVAGPDEDIGRLDVAVDDALVVDVVERQRHLQQGVEHGLDAAAGQAGDRPALEQLHREKRPAVQLAVVEDVETMRVVQRRQRSELALEPAPGRAGQRALHELERDLAAVARIAGAVDDAHASLAEHVADLEPLVPQLVSADVGCYLVVLTGGRIRRERGARRTWCHVSKVAGPVARHVESRGARRGLVRNMVRRRFGP